MNQAMSLVDGMRAQLEEHRRRMESDPGYREEYARKMAEEARREEDERRAKWEAATEKSRLDRIAKHRAEWGMPPRVIALLDSATDTEAVAKARAFMAENNPRTLLVLSGGTGCGKTVAACVALDYATAYDPWLARRMVGPGEERPVQRFNSPGRFVKAIELVRAGTFDGAFWDDLGEASVLVIDDMGTEPLDEKGWALANVAALLDARYDSLRKTVITTNLPLEKFKARYCAADGGRLYDRLREAGVYVELAGQSMRTPVPVPHWTEKPEEDEP